MKVNNIVTQRLAGFGLVGGQHRVTLAVPPHPRNRTTERLRSGRLMRCMAAAHSRHEPAGRRCEELVAAQHGEVQPLERRAARARATREQLSELELVLLDAPLGAGTQLDVLMANRPGDITMMGARNTRSRAPPRRRRLTRAWSSPRSRRAGSSTAVPRRAASGRGSRAPPISSRSARTPPRAAVTRAAPARRAARRRVAGSIRSRARVKSP